MADFPIYRLVKGNTLTFTEMDDNLRWLSRNMSGSIVTITGSVIDMSGSVNIIGDVQIVGTASIGFIKSEGYSTGSNQLGDDTSDRQTLIGTVSVSGSMGVSGSTVINDLTGSLFGTASNAVSSSYALSASYAVSSSYAYTASSAISAYTASSSVSSSYAYTASSAVSSSYAYTASSAISAYTASSAVSSSYAYTASSAISAYTASSSVSSSYAYTASSAISAYTASSSISSSYAYTASSAISAYTASSSVSSSYAYTASSAISAYTASSSISSSYAITASHAESLKIGLNLSASNINVTNNIVANSITAQSASFGYVQTITGSAVIIGQEYIILNTQTPSARYAGLIIYDSGSSTTTASLVWDSQTNHFVYSNNSGSSYSGGGFIAGPRNSGSLADVTYPTLNRVVRGQGDDHIYDSNIIDDDSKVSISIPLVVTGSITATTGFTGSLFGTASRAVSSSYALTSSYSTNISGTTNYIPIFTGVNSVSTSSIKQSLGSSYSSLEFPASSITGNVANYSDISVFSNESANLYLYSGPVNNKMSVNLQNAYGTITMLFQSGGFNNDLLSYEGYSTTNKTLTIGGYQGLVINQNGTGHFKSNLAITGSVTATQGFTGSLFGTASRAVSSSYALTSSYSTNISGTTNYVSKFTGVNSLGNSLVYDNGTSVMINTTSSHSSYTNPRLVVSDASNSYLEVRSVSGQSSLILSKGTSNTNTTPSVEFINSSNFGIVMYRPGVVSSNYLMYYNSDSATNRSLAFQTEGSDRLTLNQTGTVRLNSYTTDGFVKFSGSNGTLAVDTTTYQPLLNGSGYVSMSGTNVNYVSTIPNSGLTNSSITIQGSLTSLGDSVNVINGTGFVKASGTSITYDNSTYYLASNPNGYTTNTGTVTSITVSPGTGMSGGGTITTSGTVTLTNTAPDQIVALTQGGTTVITGTYPNFTITSNDQYTGTVTSVGGTSPIVSSGGNTPSISIPAATTSVNGYLSSTDWNVFSGKQAALSGTGFVKISGTTISYDNSTYQPLLTNPVTGTGTTNYLPKWTSGSAIGNSNFQTDASGNFGLGVTPSAWGSGLRMIDIGFGTAIGNANSLVSSWFSANAYYDTSWKYKNTAAANLYQQNGNHEWYIAPSGTAGNAITFTQAMTLTSGGNLGIGTTSPSAKLHVVGSNGSPTYRGFAYTYAGTETLINEVLFQAVVTGYSSTVPLFLFRDERTDQTTTQRIFEVQGGRSGVGTILTTLANGNVGIGTTSPGVTLDVSGSGIRIINSTSPNVYFNNTTVQWKAYMPSSTNNFAINDAIRDVLTLGYNGAASYFSGCNVGIGTTSPLAKLHLVGELRNSFGSGVGGTNYLNIIDGVSNGFRTTITTGNAITYTFHNGANSEVFNILESGNVGIGTTSPGSKLEVNGSTSIIGQTIVTSDSTEQIVIKTLTSTNRQLLIGYNYTPNYAYIQAVEQSVAYRNLLLNPNGGNVGIGTTSPAAKLDVSGSILANNFNSDNAVVNTADTYTSTAKITNIITLTQAEYNAIGSPSSNYLYVII